MKPIRDAEQFRETELLKKLWRYFRKDKLALGSFYLFLLLLTLVLLGNVLAPYNYDQQFVGLELMPPSSDLHVFNLHTYP